MAVAYVYVTDPSVGPSRAATAFRATCRKSQAQGCVPRSNFLGPAKRGRSSWLRLPRRATMELVVPGAQKQRPVEFPPAKTQATVTCLVATETNDLALAAWSSQQPAIFNSMQQ